MGSLAHGNDTITDFTDGEDRIDLGEFGDSAPTFAEVRAAASGIDGGVRIDLSSFGGGTVDVMGLALSDLDAADFAGLGAPPPVGTSARDYLVGGARADNITAMGGNDFVFSGRGNDTVRGGDGSDWIEGGAGNDSLYGGANGAGPDILAGQSGNDRLVGEGGNDRLWGGGGNDTLYGGDGGDSALDGGAGRDRIYGGAGDDFLNGGAGSDTLTGGPGADVFRFNAYQTNRADRDVVTDYAEGDLVQLNMRGVLHTTAAEYGGFTLDGGVLIGHGFHIALQGPGVGSLELDDVAVV